VLQCVAVCCSVLQRVAACCSVLQRVAVCCSVLQRVAACCSVLQRVAACCSVLQWYHDTAAKSSLLEKFTQKNDHRIYFRIFTQCCHFTCRCSTHYSKYRHYLATKFTQENDHRISFREFLLDAASPHTDALYIILKIHVILLLNSLKKLH